MKLFQVHLIWNRKNRKFIISDMHKPFFNSMTLEKLKAFLKMRSIVPPYESINAIDKTEDLVITHSDSRGGGQSFQFK